MEPFLFSLAAFISTLCGGLFSLHFQKRVHYIMSFTAGVLIAVCFFDIIPEIFSIVQEKGLDLTIPLTSVVIGYLAIHILEKYAVIHHSHEGEYADHRHPQVGVVSSLGLIFHSFLDGLGIGLGFHINPTVGVVVALAVIAHDFSDGLNTVSLMLINKNSRKKAVVFLIADALAPLLGVLSTYFLVISDQVLILYLGFFAGFLLYIGSSDLLPEAHSKHSSWKMVGLTILGVVFIFAITRFT
ncbi:MAG: ZIP family metal transporter [Patescibacteria group bacterium]